MKNINTGGPAFPVPGLHGNSDYDGMDLRDYLAAKAMQGVLASLQEGDDFNARGCEWCYKVADDMLKARGK
jgi:hypothetical protein